MITIKKTKRNDSIKDKVERISGIDLDVCLQCKKCSSGCPVANQTLSRPSEIMRRLHLGAGDELLESDIIWTCASCGTCSARCPMNIDVAAVMDALRKISLDKKVSRQKGNVPLFNRAFLKTVEVFGRTYEIAMITAYKLGTGKLRDDVEKFPTMLRKGKMSLIPSLKGDRKTVRRIFRTIKRNKGKKI